MKEIEEIEEIMEEEVHCVEADEEMINKIIEGIKASNFFKEVIRITSKYKDLPLYLEFRHSPLHSTLLCGLFAIGDGTMDSAPENAQASLYIPDVHLVEQQLGELLHNFLCKTRQSYPKFSYNTELFYDRNYRPKHIIGRNGTLVQTFEMTFLDGANNQIVARTVVKICSK